MKKLSEYTSKDGKFVHQAKAGRYGGSKPDAEKPMRAPKAKDIKDIEKDDKKPELSDHPFKFKKKTEAVEKIDELSKKTLDKYQSAAFKDKADADMDKHSGDFGQLVRGVARSNKREKGIGNASTRLGQMRRGERKDEGVDEKLVGNQHKIDANKDGKITSHDFKKLRKQKGETATMNPKMDSGKGNNSMEQKEAVRSADKEPEAYTDPRTGKVKYRMVTKDKDMIKQESTIRQKLLSIFEKKDAHTKGAVSDPMGSNIKGAGAQKMVDDNKDDGRYHDMEKKSHDDASKAARVTKPAAGRTGDQKTGDKSVINPPEDITKKGKADAGVKEETFMDKVVAYLRK